MWKLNRKAVDSWDPGQIDFREWRQKEGSLYATSCPQSGPQANDSVANFMAWELIPAGAASLICCLQFCPFTHLVFICCSVALALCLAFVPAKFCGFLYPNPAGVEKGQITRPHSSFGSCTGYLFKAIHFQSELTSVPLLPPVAQVSHLEGQKSFPSAWSWVPGSNHIWFQSSKCEEFLFVCLFHCFLCDVSRLRCQFQKSQGLKLIAALNERFTTIGG